MVENIEKKLAKIDSLLMLTEGKGDDIDEGDEEECDVE